MKRLAVYALGLILFLNQSANAQITFTGSGFAIPDVGPAPTSVINVSGYTGTVTSFTVTLTGIEHTFFDDLAAVVTGPGGQQTLLFDGPTAGATTGVVNLTFDDAAAVPMSNTGALVGGSFRPGQNQYNSVFDNAPAGPYATTFTAFTGGAPDGDYTLYIEDFATGDSGNLVSWSITMTGITPVPEPVTTGLLAVAGLGGLTALRRRFRKTA